MYSLKDPEESLNHNVFYTLQGESLDMNVQLPETSTSRPVLLALAAHARPANRSAEVSYIAAKICRKLYGKTYSSSC